MKARSSSLSYNLQLGRFLSEVWIQPDGSWAEGQGAVSYQQVGSMFTSGCARWITVHGGCSWSSSHRWIADRSRLEGAQRDKYNHDTACVRSDLFTAQVPVRWDVLYVRVEGDRESGFLDSLIRAGHSHSGRKGQFSGGRVQ